MSTLEIIITAVSSIIGIIGGGVGVFFWKENKALKQKEVEAAAIDNELKQAEAWKDLYEQEHERSERKSEEKRALYAERDDLKESNAKKDLRIEQLCWYYCTRPNCDKRNPPHRFDERGYEIHADIFDPKKNE